ncbi:MAG: RNA polymerase sigma factor [Thermoanaerobaculia bacterium]
MSSVSVTPSGAAHAWFTAVYEEYFGFLCDVAMHRFRVPPAAAEDVVHEVFLSFLTVRHEVRDPRAWLIGGVCNASRRYWSLSTESLDDAPRCLVSAETEELMEEITVRQVVGRLHAKCRRTLQLHYWEGATPGEMAGDLRTTPAYARKLIHQCLRKAWRAWHHLWREA